ncbi:hypothetical protein [Lutispora thermophila]|uniref:Uncharacterized protein n=1 Tax=Lutispora thermophila DSM 19022 TaxID=1122184 RepID=A0A1M6IKW3_9FIRM|nr:hypothetical protein [Lutispora thermophila]SHJ35015.1 hypothetical protein SAMN02745176_03299 [Lutispora thermophila DSM 19022]
MSEKILIVDDEHESSRCNDSLNALLISIVVLLMLHWSKLDFKYPFLCVYWH